MTKVVKKNERRNSVSSSSQLASVAKPFSFEPFVFLMLKVLVSVVRWCHGRQHTEIPSVCVCSHVAVVLPPDTILMDKWGP